LIAADRTEWRRKVDAPHPAIATDQFGRAGSLSVPLSV